MLSRFGGWFRRWFVALQVAVLLIWLGFELAGTGFGLLAWLARRPITSVEPNISDLWRNPPPGPMRLSSEERREVQRRLSAAFKGAIPKHHELADLESHYELMPGSNCRRRRNADIAFDTGECNRLKGATSFFVALLRAMHPKRQHLFLVETNEAGGGQIQAAFFVGLDEKPMILLDLSRIASARWQTAHGFTGLAAHGGGTGSTALDLGREVAPGIRLLADPGQFQRRAMCPPPGCPARLIIKGVGIDGTRDSMNRQVLRTVAEIVLDERIERRFAFYAALADKPAGAPPPARIDRTYKSESFAVTDWWLAQVRGRLDAAMGVGTAARARYASTGMHVAFGAVAAFRLDGALYLIFDGGMPHPSLGTDRLVFHLVDGDTKTRIASPRNDGGLWVLLLPMDAARRSSTTLVVHKEKDIDGPPWSELDGLARLAAPLLR